MFEKIFLMGIIAAFVLHGVCEIVKAFQKTKRLEKHLKQSLAEYEEQTKQFEQMCSVKTSAIDSMRELSLEILRKNGNRNTSVVLPVSDNDGKEKDTLAPDLCNVKTHLKALNKMIDASSKVCDSIQSLL